MRNGTAVGCIDLIKGILFIALGILLLPSPQIAVSGIVVLLAIGVLLSGVTDILTYTGLRKYASFSLPGLLASGIASAVIGIGLLINPAAGRWFLSIAIPVWLMSFFLSRISGAGFVRRTAGTPAAVIMLCLNILGLLISVVMIFNSSLFTMSLGAMLAINLILLGVIHLAEAVGGIKTARTGNYPFR